LRPSVPMSARPTPPDPERPEEDLEDLYENAPCGYLSITTRGRIFKANRTIAGWLGFTTDELNGKRISDFLNMAGRIYYETHFAPLLRMQGFFNEVALDCVTRAGVVLPVLVSANERRDAEGKHLFTRLIIFNATERRRYERDLVKAQHDAEARRAEVQELNKEIAASLSRERETAALREQFIAVLGHDMRNPLAAIDSGMHLLLRTPLNEKATKIVQMVQDSVKRSVGLIDNVMDFARGRLGSGIILEREPVELEPVLRHVIAELQTTAPDRVIEATFTVVEPIDCDRQRISQLLSNLLGNALTYGAPDQAIRITTSTKGGEFELSVANAGEAIPQATMDVIFEPFSRGTHRPSMQGLGLGLYIAHQVARAHGGDLSVTSNADETCFTFRMPLGGVNEPT
jgi:sigma-B regulation protein RsbU (phosphoserine phosphatase)